MDFSEKVVLITGASSGIGAATAIYFAKLGASLSLTSRHGENLKEVADRCAFFSKKEPIVTLGDLTNLEDVKILIDDTIKHFLTIDVLVNTAGIFEKSSINNVNKYDMIFNTNVRSVISVTSLAVPYIIKSKGVIVNISGAHNYYSNGLLYSMSKAAIMQFTIALAKELAPKNVRVNCVNPGVISTELFRKGGLDESEYQEFLHNSKSLIGKVGTPDDVASTIAFLACNHSRYITGASIPVDGGKLLL